MCRLLVCRLTSILSFVQRSPCVPWISSATTINTQCRTQNKLHILHKSEMLCLEYNYQHYLTILLLLITVTSLILCRFPKSDPLWLVKQGVTLTGRNTTGLPRAAPWWVMLHMRVLHMTDDDDRRRQRQTSATVTSLAPLQCVGRPVTNFRLHAFSFARPSLSRCQMYCT